MTKTDASKSDHDCGEKRHEYHKDNPIIALKWLVALAFFAGVIVAIRLIFCSNSSSENQEWGRTILAGVIGAALGMGGMKAAGH